MTASTNPRVNDFLSSQGRLFIGPTMPFGGFKPSGWGREHGSEVLDAYTQTKSVMINL